MIAFIRNEALGKLLLRLNLGILMLFHGIAKVKHMNSLDSISSSLVKNGLPEFIAYGVYIGEIIAPLMIIFGFRSRLGGLMILITMIFAIYLKHMDQLYILGNHGGYALELQLFFLFSALSVMFLGSGRYAIKPD